MLLLPPISSPVHRVLRPHLQRTGFKAVNDTSGHLSGDHVLVEVAARFRHCVRNSNVAARLAGNEFTVLLTGSGSEEHAVALSR